MPEPRSRQASQPDRLARVLLMTIAILTPSRDRPQQLLEMVQSTLATAEGKVEIFIGLDCDDREDYTRIAALRDSRVHVCRAQRMQLGAWTNHLAELTWLRFPILASFGDDHRPRTNGWDTRVREAFDRMGPGLVYTADGLQDERLPTAPFWSAEVIRELGWYFPPKLKHLYADDFWLAMANRIGRRSYLPDVLIEHLHPSSGKSEPDAINEANDSHYDADRLAFTAYMADRFDADAQRVREALR